MLKRILQFLIATTVFYASAYVSPTYAASADIIITQIQAGGEGAALQELVVLFNSGDSEVDVSGWKLHNKSGQFATLGPDTTGNYRLYLPARSFATVGSQAMATATGLQFTQVYESSNQSSGAIVGSKDTITLYTSTGDVVDSKGWTTSLAGGMIIERLLATSSPLAYYHTGAASDWQVASPMFIPDNETVFRAPTTDMCSNLPGVQLELPPNHEVYLDGTCWLVLTPIMITEVLANAIGSDEGQEFIEIHNPNDIEIELSNYRLQVGPQFEKIYSFPAGASIPSGGFRAFSNSDIKFSLLNTTSRIRIVAADLSLIDEPPVYSDPKEGESWGMIANGSWAYSNRPSPSAANLEWLQPGVPAEGEDDNGPTKPGSTLKPCAANQYRNPATNRCKLRATASSAPAPCRADQYRNPQTNRCRKIETKAGLAPCKEGQERNPDTNRCRNVPKMSQVGYEVLGATTTATGNDRWYIWVVVASLIALAAGYAAWEWRSELARLLGRLGRFIRRQK